MTTRIGINGFGRIGRSVFRILSDRDDIQVVAVNDLFENEQLAYLLKFDTVMGVLNKDVSVDGDFMHVNGDEIAMIDEKDPAKIPWAQFDVDFVIESTGVFRNREPLEKHLEGGAKKVILALNGFGANREMLQKYIPQMSSAYYFGHEGNTGEGIKWGEALGAKLEYMGAYQAHGSVAYPHGTLLTWVVISLGGYQVVR